MPPRPPRPSPSARPRQGFALVVTVTLLAFLVLLLVSLASLTRIETQVAANSRQLSAARQHALLALNLALGELQKNAGPDQRVTARADLLTTHAGSPDVDDPQTAFDAYWRTRNRHWIGAWGNGAGRIGYDLRPDEIAGRGVEPVSLGWLVSGNENRSFTLAANGGVSAPQPPRFDPSLVVGGLSAEATADTAFSFPVPDDAGDSATTPGALLVGPGSASDGTAAGRTASHAAGHYVVAPSVAITAPADSLPGLDGPAPVVVGRYAWWVGDEGLKARVNLRPGYQQTGTASDRIHSFITAQRAALEFMDRDVSGAPLGFDPGTGFDFTAPLLPGVLTRSQLPLVGGTGLAAAARNRFHDLTTTSRGVLADTYAGGLRKDLTADIADTSASGNDAAGLRPADSAPLFTPRNASEANLPTWGLLRSWARTHPDASGAVPPVPPSDTQAGFSPIVFYASLGLDIFVDHSGSIRIALYPVVALGNPYPVAIAPARYDLGFRFQAGSRIDFRTAPARAAGTVPASSHYTTVAAFDLGSLSILPGDPPASDLTGSTPVRFVIDGQVIPPGETHVYRLDDALNEQTYTPGARLIRAPSGSATAPIGLLNHLYVPATFTLAPGTLLTATPGEPGPPAVPGQTSTFLRAESRNVGYTYTHAVEVALAEEGGLADLARRYQSFDLIPGSSGLRGGRLLLTKTAEEEEISKFWLRTASDGARGALLRLWTQLEGGGLYSTPGNFGLAQSNRIWLRQGNIRAPFARPTLLENGPALSASDRIGATLFGAVLCNDNNPVAGSDPALAVANNRHIVNMAGQLGAAANPRYTTLFDVLESPARLLSVGQLQNAPFARYDFHTAYPFGNSIANPRVERTATWRDNLVLRPGTASTYDAVYDLSWHLNRALWDRTFVSGVPSGWTQADVDAGAPLPNAGYAYHRASGPPAVDDLRYQSGTNRAYDRAAARLLVSGAFNINSTSEQAWRAILGSPRGQPAHGDYSGDADDAVDRIVPYPRISHNLARPDPGPPYSPLTATMRGNTANATAFRAVLYHGNRGLWLRDSASGANASAEAVVNELARTLVREIRRGGPFLSLADFVNRPILSTRQDAGIKGALQRALDTMETAQANPFDRWQAALGSAINTTSVRSGWDYEHWLGAPASEFNTSRASFRFHQAFSPKWLTQADLLSTLGPRLSVRSDTFTLRTYGETVNPLTGLAEGRAWCEAVVQRLPGYLHAADPSEAAPTGENRAFGRRFQLVSFRWLSAGDI